jgi:hypothetical protein
MLFGYLETRVNEMLLLQLAILYILNAQKTQNSFIYKMQIRNKNKTILNEKKKLTDNRRR